uniref:EXS domain-containing protein n=1 Tax=Hyaloperonospora arabidopsidis (strain Emoy2) TaxID=559515 RepID=M4BZZ9_HYAAE
MYATTLSDKYNRYKHRDDAPATAQESLKNSLVELHRMLNLLHNFAVLNYTGFVKLFKRYDKILSVSVDKRKEQKAKLQTFEFAKARSCLRLLKRVERSFADWFCDGNVTVAVVTLMTKKEDFVNWGHIYLGIKSGSCLVLLIWVCWDSLVVPTFRNERKDRLIDLVRTRAYPVYRGIGCLLLLHWLVGVSLYVWRAARINYRYIFELNPRRAQSYPQVFSDATNMTIVYLANVLLYYKVVNGYFPEELLHRGYYPLVLFLYTFYFYAIRPWGQQLGMLRTLWEVVCSPLYPVSFFHTFVGDYLTSTVKVTQDVSWSICFFATKEFLRKDVNPIAVGTQDPQTSPMDSVEETCADNVYYLNVVVPLVCVLPLWWRFLQNLRRVYDTKTWWPHLPNAAKYALAQVVVLFGLFHPLYSDDSDETTLHMHVRMFVVVWLFLFTASSLYTWIWDVTMDWGLGRPQFKFLGDSQMFSRKWVYYAAIVADLFLRFAWTVTLIPPRGAARWLPLYLQPFTIVLELFRRTFWSFFRLENEHLRNTQGFRRVDFIPLHYDHGVGDVDKDVGNQEEQLDFRVFTLKILAVLFTVLGLSVIAIVVER